MWYPANSAASFVVIQDDFPMFSPLLVVRIAPLSDDQSAALPKRVLVAFGPQRLIHAKAFIALEQYSEQH